MKKFTLSAIAILVALGAAALIEVKNKPNTPTPVASENNVWFNTIQIADGITVEFEYGNRLQVFVEGDKDLVNQLALVLDNHVLHASGNCGEPVKKVRIKVVTPVLISLARQSQNTPSNCDNQNEIKRSTGKEVPVKPVAMQQIFFQISTQYA